MVAWEKYRDRCPPLDLMAQTALGIKPTIRHVSDDPGQLIAHLKNFPGAVVEDVNA